MSSPFRPLRDSQMWTNCEECHRRVNLSGAGACVRCRRILCDAHLHGGFFRRLAVDMGAAAMCLRCRRGA